MYLEAQTSYSELIPLRWTDKNPHLSVTRYLGTKIPLVSHCPLPTTVKPLYNGHALWNQSFLGSFLLLYRPFRGKNVLAWYHWDCKTCPWYGGFLYCVLNSESPLIEVPLYHCHQSLCGLKCVYVCVCVWICVVCVRVCVCVVCACACVCAWRHSS